MFVLLNRYYTRIVENAVVHVSLEMEGINPRLVARGDALPLYGTFASAEAESTLQIDYTVPELRAFSRRVSHQPSQEDFGVFNWNGPDPNMVRICQQRLLSRTS